VFVVCGIGFGIFVLCLVAVAFLQPPLNGEAPRAAAGGGSPGSAAFATSVPVVLQCDRSGVKGQITNRPGVPLSKVTIVVNVVENNRSPPIIRRVYNLEPAGSIKRGETVDWQITWDKGDSRVYAMAKGRLAATAEVTALIGVDGQVLYEAPQPIDGVTVQ
jgi:hypothetical protein